MIEAKYWSLCDRDICISKAKMEQILIFNNQRSIFAKTFEPVFANWKTLFPDVYTLCDQLPVELDRAITRFAEELQYLFWDYGEEVPYDDDSMQSTMSMALINSQMFTLLNEYQQGFLSLNQSTEQKLGNAPSIGGNSVHIGLGLEGAIGAGLANAGLGLLDYGIGKVSDNRTMRHHEKRVNELLHSDQAMAPFIEIAIGVSVQGVRCAMSSIAQRCGETPILDITHSDWNKRRPGYANLSKADKISECLHRLEENPIHNAIYQELLELTDASDPALIAYGNEMFPDERGDLLRKEIGKQRYEAALTMPDNSLEEIAAKLNAIKEAYRILQENVDENEVYANLYVKHEMEDGKRQIKVGWEFLTEQLRTLSDADLSVSKYFCTTSSLSVFAQEVYYRQAQYKNLPSDYHAFSENGNGVPELMYGELEAKRTGEPVALWNRWARKGNPYALLRLGLCRLHGNGIEKDVVRSRQLIQKAADANYAPAMYLLKQIAYGKYKPGFGSPTSEDRTKYDTALTLMDIPEETYSDYLSFGRK